MKKVTLLAWVRTIQLLIKHRFNLEKVKKETDNELTDTVSETILKNAYSGKERSFNLHPACNDFSCAKFCLSKKR
jgi:hypothetical protein